jgi:hypothetical protein
MISESLGSVWAVESTVTRDSSSLMISESLGLFVPSNPRATRDTSSMMISEYLGAVWAVDSTRPP